MRAGTQQAPQIVVTEGVSARGGRDLRQTAQQVVTVIDGPGILLAGQAIEGVVSVLNRLLLAVRLRQQVVYKCNSRRAWRGRLLA